MGAIQLRLIDTGSTHSLSDLLSAVEMNLRTWTALEIAQWVSAAIISTHVCVPHILTTATVWGWCLFRLELPIVRLLFDGSNYLSAATIQWWCLIKEICAISSQYTCTIAYLVVTLCTFHVGKNGFIAKVNPLFLLLYSRYFWHCHDSYWFIVSRGGWLCVASDCQVWR